MLKLESDLANEVDKILWYFKITMHRLIQQGEEP